MNLLDDTPKNQIADGVFRSAEAISRSDEEILARSVANPDLFSEIVDRYEDAFLRKAKDIIKKDTEAEDLVQDAFVKIYLNASRFRVQEGATFKSWAYKILINTCLTKYNKIKKERVYLQDLDPEITELVASKEETDKFDRKLDTDYILSAISKLPVMLGRVLKLYSIDGKPQKEIAKIEGISLGAVRARVHRAKKELKKVNLNALI